MQSQQNVHFEGTSKKPENKNEFLSIRMFKMSQKHFSYQLPDIFFRIPAILYCLCYVDRSNNLEKKMY